MEEMLEHFVSGTSLWVLGIMIIAAFFSLAKGADALVNESVSLSLKWNVPKAVIGATIVSLGTTTPEAVVSVLASLRGEPELALGNAVGSILCDTGLILGGAILISSIPINRQVLDRQVWLQLGCGLLLVLACIPWTSSQTMFTEGGRLSQGMGFAFLGLLALYLWFSIRWGISHNEEIDECAEEAKSNALLIFMKLMLAVAVVIFSSWVVIPCVKEVAVRFNVPAGIIAATLVAFGTSLPEMVTVFTSAMKGHGEVGLGNVIGADILNVLFVAGASAAVTSGGLHATGHFFKLLFPAMILVLLILRIGVFTSGTTFKKKYGFILLGVYLLVTFLGYRI